MQSSKAYWNVGTKALYPSLPYVPGSLRNRAKQSRAGQEHLRCVHKLPLVELEGSCLPPASPWPPLNASFPSDRRAFLPNCLTVDNPRRPQAVHKFALQPRRLESRGHGRRRPRCCDCYCPVLSCPACPHLRRAPFSLDLPLVLGAWWWGSPLFRQAPLAPAQALPNRRSAHLPSDAIFLRPLVLNPPHRTATRDSDTVVDNLQPHSGRPPSNPLALLSPCDRIPFFQSPQRQLIQRG
jgi:hypothetical protein